MGPEYIIYAENVYKSFGGVVALRNVSLGLRPRTITMIIGPNGSGKTTLINVISGVYRPDRGRIFFDGTDITGWPPHRIFSRGLARTFQVPALFTKLTVLENMLVVARGNPGESLFKAIFRGSWIKYEEELVEKAFRILDILNLSDLWDKRARELSGGQMKLLEIGRTLMCDPTAILMDEPLAGVNPSLAYNILEYLKNIRDRENVSFLVIEHRLDILLPYIDYVYFMVEGRVFAQGRPEEVMENKAVLEAYLGE
ncbi:ABC transporter ATP-binding protein [Candidatus Geothermarchaeota archaeon]|nr:MAG: ABC transporter ATP-binding protein [Candidatus Geothermarchaeota archaeon]